MPKHGRKWLNMVGQKPPSMQINFISTKQIQPSNRHKTLTLNSQTGYD